MFKGLKVQCSKVQRFNVQCSKFQSFGFKYSKVQEDKAFGFWNLDLSIWLLVFGSWNLGLGIWTLEL